MQNWANILIDWFALPSLALLACILLYRKLHREYPLFFCYLVVTEAVGLIRYAASSASSSVYSYVYWVSDLILVSFACLASYELFVGRLFPRFYKVRFFRILFPLAAILVNVVIVIAAIYGNHKRMLLLSARIVEFLRAAVIFFFVALMTVMGRKWEKKEFGIAFGFGLEVSVSLASVALWTHETRRSPFVSRIPVIAYDIACIVWLYCFLTASKAQTLPPALSTETLQAARKWEDSLKDFMSQGKR
ncbi:MAG TPA: hypothetical protein VKV30_05890 [Candidatus Angelobacter sp.]|nr:hypothetical protein [Candidatus Angelobacter sp.]